MHERDGLFLFITLLCLSAIWSCFLLLFILLRCLFSRCHNKRSIQSNTHSSSSKESTEGWENLSQMKIHVNPPTNVFKKSARRQDMLLSATSTTEILKKSNELLHNDLVLAEPSNKDENSSMDCEGHHRTRTRLAFCGLFQTMNNPRPEFSSNHLSSADRSATTPDCSTLSPKATEIRVSAKMIGRPLPDRPDLYQIPFPSLYAYPDYGRSTRISLDSHYETPINNGNSTYLQSLPNLPEHQEILKEHQYETDNVKIFSPIADRNIGRLYGKSEKITPRLPPKSKSKNKIPIYENSNTPWRKNRAELKQEEHIIVRVSEF